MTLGQLAITVAVLGGLGLLASRFGLSAIPAYLFAGLLLGPNEPEVLSFIEPSEVTDFVAQLGIVFLLFFLGLEFTLDRFRRSGRHFGLGGSIDLVVNVGLGLLVGVAAFGFSFATLILAAAIYVSSSAVAVKGIAFVLAFAAGGGGDAAETFELVGKALAFIVLSLAASRWLARPIDRLLDAMPREFFLIFTFTILVGMAALAHVLGMSEAIGALMGGVILSETSVRAEIEERFLAFRDIFAALFFFVFGLSIDIDELGRLGWLLALAVVVSVGGKMASTYAAGRVGGFTPRQSVNAGSALVARGEFTIILAQLAAANEALSAGTRADMVAFAGLYVLATALLGVVLMKESKRLGRFLFPLRPRLE